MEGLKSFKREVFSELILLWREKEFLQLLGAIIFLIFLAFSLLFAAVSIIMCVPALLFTL